ncbi:MULTISPECIES: GntR family transcriptional regulator [Pseudonocardia]|uniref:HTH-type transcriptional repressor YvoA n=2 Tax=Pseudonocardia TaxID=1847 RepID=A0A1Y2MUT0_PSEAH|nr:MULTISPECIES: GntR family transcriptional regulator [Pseudonocardia]OSY38388.1 HTH-type transcriptional repressor YvoA [Pseudonocardia autotrophica]TDN72568.1 DNA-binding GntR family transcriptional regulator [Pseudonocardia autotrophica]BBG03276.1 transcriptional regulator [Pseudonocardia autotrophica]GEC24534.1 transcriptional regulator [Pseudonocardia saturnea]
MAEPGSAVRDTPDRGSPVPLYFQVAGHIQSMVDSGELVAGSRLPHEAELLERLRTSRSTLRRAVSYLVELGVLARRRGAGIRVLPRRAELPADLCGLHDELLRAGRVPTTELRSFEIGPAGEHIAAALGLPVRATVTRFERLRLADGEPLALLSNRVPVGVLPLRADDLAVRGLYDLLRDAGHAPRRARQLVGARAATPEEAAILGEAPGAPLLTMTSTSWDDAGAAVEYGSHLYRASRYSIELNPTASGIAPA